MDAIGGTGAWIEHAANLETEVGQLKAMLLIAETQVHTLELERDLLMEVLTKLHLAKHA